MKTVTHYAGEIRHAKGMVLGGWAACCSGKRAEAIRARGTNTRIREDVTCTKCLAMIEKGRQWAERKTVKP